MPVLKQHKVKGLNKDFIYDSFLSYPGTRFWVWHRTGDVVFRKEES